MTVHRQDPRENAAAARPTNTPTHTEEQFKRLVQGVVDYAIYALDLNGLVTTWNLGAQRIKGYAPQEIIGEHFSRFYTPEDRQRGDPAVALATAAREGSFQKEGWRIRKDGSRFWASVVIDAVRDDAGNIIGFTKITRDITERREAQAALDRATEALFQSQKMEAIGQLTGGVAHDFNNLLTAILGSLEIVRRKVAQDPKLVNVIDNALNAARRGASLTQRMLAFARRQELTLEPVDVRALLLNMRDLLERSLSPSVSVQLNAATGLSAIRADANQLELALLNLAVNARDAMDGTGTLVLSVTEEIVEDGHRTALPPGRFILISAIDTGHGMDEETLARAADPFFTTKGIGKGTGLGLSMVQGLVEQFGGRLLLKSKQNVGTTVEMWLPVTSLSPEAAAVKSDTAKLTHALANIVILVVDDDDLVLQNTRLLLEDLGYATLAARSAAEAMLALRAHKELKLVITDQVMPKTTGAELAVDIHDIRPELPIIIATGYAELYGTDLPASRLAKPFTQEQLSRAVAIALN